MLFQDREFSPRVSGSANGHKLTLRDLTPKTSIASSPESDLSQKSAFSSEERESNTPYTIVDANIVSNRDQKITLIGLVVLAILSFVIQVGLLVAFIFFSKTEGDYSAAQKVGSIPSSKMD